MPMLCTRSPVKLYLESCFAVLGYALERSILERPFLKDSENRPDFGLIEHRLG
jgi:hypothetical protein